MALKSNGIDAKIENTVKKFRAFFAQSPMPSISTLQQNSLKERSVLGSMWVSRVTLPCPDAALCMVLCRGIKSVSSHESRTWMPPSLEPVEIEWVGHKVGFDSKSLAAETTDEENYHNLTKDASSSLTLLYVHGGGFYRGDPSTFRPFLRKLANLTRGRCVSVRYRLAPQHPFPAALLDVLVAYLSLLYPPPNTFHEPIPASKVVIAGDSGGANLCLALVQFILHLQGRNGSNCTVKWFDRDVTIPLPAGVSAFSAWTELTNALPSFTANEEHDYFSATNALERVPPCNIWPTNPPRGALYCDISMLCHPMVSPTQAETWAGSPPMLFCCGDEMLVDNSKVIAQRAANEGCIVVWLEYEAMPHCFPFNFNLPQTDDTFQRWANFCSTCVERPYHLKTEGSRISKLAEAQPVDVRRLTKLSSNEVRERTQQGMQKMGRNFEEKMSVTSKL